MIYFLAALQTEFLKIRKSRVIWLTIAAFSIAPLMAGFFMFILKDPAFAKNAGLIEAKAQIAGEASWPSYLELYAQIIAVGGIIVFGFVTSWIFGREYTDKTAKDLLVLPYSKTITVTAKFIAGFITNIVLCIYIVSLGFFIGWTIGLSQWSTTIVIDGLYTLIVVTILTTFLSTPVAFLASYGAGYLAPLGFVIVTLILSQIIAVTSFGKFFPWAIPALYSGLTGETILSLSSIFIILFTSLVGFFSTLYWWTFADQH